MHFKTQTDMINHIEKNTEFTVIKKGADKSDIFWIFTEEGIKTLAANGYQPRDQVVKMINETYNQIKSSSVITDEMKKFHSLLLNAIRNA